MTTMKMTIVASTAAFAAMIAAPALAQDHGAHGDHGDHAKNDGIGHMQMADEIAWSEPYTLDTCPVSGEQFGSEMGEPIIKTYEGREVRFCCKGCVKDFEADQAGFFKKIDEQIIKDQLRYYPDVCIVSGEPLTDGGEDIAINYVYGNRLVRFCCKSCKKDFLKDPETFIGKLDEATADAQREDYPLDTCPVSGEAYGSMGDPTEMVLAGRFIRFCCDGCKPKVMADPAKYLAEIDKAWQAKGMYMPDDAMTTADHGAMGHDMKDGHGKTMGGGHGGNDGHGDHDH